MFDPSDPAISSAYDEWLKTRPASVQKLAAEFPPGTAVNLDGEQWFVFSYTEGDEVSLTPVHPADDYTAAFKERRLVHAECLRKAMATDEST